MHKVLSFREARCSESDRSRRHSLKLASTLVSLGSYFLTCDQVSEERQAWGDLGNSVRAIEAFEQAQAIYEEHQEDVSVATCLGWISSVQQNWVPMHEREYARSHILSMQIASLCHDAALQGRYMEAERLLMRALEMRKDSLSDAMADLEDGDANVETASEVCTCIFFCAPQKKKKRSLQL